MPTIAAPRKFDDEHVVSILHDAGKRLRTEEGEIVLDLSAVHRINAYGLRELEKFASLADQNNVNVVLLGVNVDVYKVLTLMSLTSRFWFVN
jgi:anti-anti-sigma regulatory factor